MDYKNLLKKYMRGVGNAEGVYFEKDCSDCSLEEIEILSLLIKEINHEDTIINLEAKNYELSRKIFHLGEDKEKPDGK